MARWWAAVVGICLVVLGGAGAVPRPQETPGGVVQRIDGPCSSSNDCQLIDHGKCDMATGTCQCVKTHPIPNEVSCLRAVAVNETCSITAQCRPETNHAECVHGVCQCQPKYEKHTYSDGNAFCLMRSEHVADAKKTPVDPVMIGILASMVLMFVIICVVLRLFSKAQFRQNRTILNSANPRLMNASFLKGSLIKSPVEQLRGSHSSRGSRAPSLSSLQRPDNEKRGAENSGTTDVNLVQVELNQP
ncbi:uncharacterized protein LOC122364739 isoform X2 [Amphibalanus amphitrite]|uniref:uncharacterized protein LOC122364739 isoform X2 n=1 Tax=Amphibalanus amphitrite TaxID=1232801 RepID=UPI001C9268CB|nr:uncharacterized protein LOC122364739 isoform X2 [Amphibalanus amphitrite]